MAQRKKSRLSPLEHRAMQVVWTRGRASAEEVRSELAAQRPIKDSTARTILRRLEEKGYVKHTAEGRTFVYFPKVAPRSVAVEAIRGIIDRFCSGSVEDLVVGMVDDEIISTEKLRELAQRISEAEDAADRGAGNKRGDT
jgi:BlaI family transcriptional regulator, penicillinase repressor